MRKRGANPRDVLEQINAHRTAAGRMGMHFSFDFANVMKQPAVPADSVEPAADQNNEAS